jgi:hypothetical protein
MKSPFLCLTGCLTIFTAGGISGLVASAREYSFVPSIPHPAKLQEPEHPWGICTCTNPLFPCDASSFQTLGCTNPSAQRNCVCPSTGVNCVGPAAALRCRDDKKKPVACVAQSSSSLGLFSFFGMVLGCLIGFGSLGSSCSPAPRVP